MSLTVFTPDHDAAAIGTLWRKACQSLVDSTRYYLECGQLLLAKKDSLAHGEWLPWLAANADVLGFKDRAANQMMKTAQNPQWTADLDEATAVAVNRELWGNTKPRGAQGTGKFEWYTPRKYIGAVRAVLGEIDLDPASSEIAQRTVRAAKYFTIDDDGLSQDWHGRAFLNPPYAQPLTERFVAKLIAEHEAGHVSEAILLTHNFTCTRWCQDALWACRAFCHTRGRIKFIDPDGELANKPTQGQTFFYFGHRPEVFAAVFADIGFVALGWAGQAMMLEAAE